MSDKTTNDKLLNCPFCGGEAELDSDSRFDNWFIRCNKCLCKTRTFKTERSAILTWNNRKPMEKIIEKFNELEHLSFSRISKPLIELEDAIRIIKEEGGLND